jgi:hypothetical protein
LVEHATENRGVAGSIPALAISRPRPGSQLGAVDCTWLPDMLPDTNNNKGAKAL